MAREWLFEVYQNGDVYYSGGAQRTKRAAIEQLDSWLIDIENAGRWEINKLDECRADVKHENGTLRHLCVVWNY